jgi:hypothetical protein
MVADCKSAALRSYGGSNPPLCTRFERVAMEKRKRFYVAMGIYAVLAVLVWATMADVPIPVGNGHLGIRTLTLLVLALFAVRTVLHWRAEQIRDTQEGKEVSS